MYELLHSQRVYLNSHQIINTFNCPLHPHEQKRMHVMLFQILPFQIVYAFIVILLFILSVYITYAIRFIHSRLFEEGRTGRFVDWWNWINRSDSQNNKPKVYTPKFLLDKHVESWSCPICGSNLTPKDVKQLEYGYNIACEYCGATLGSSPTS